MKYKEKSIIGKLYYRLSLTANEFLLLLLIALFSFFLRFVNYSNRWGLAYDQARDGIVSHQILVNMEIPISGPFSASGPFVFGPFWYWFHALVTALNPHSVMWLWFVQTSISALMPIVMFFIGRKIIDSRFGFIVAFFTAISTAQIAQSTNLTYSTFVGFISVFILLFLGLFIKTKKTIYIFLMSLLMGLAVNVHFQAVGYFLFLPIILALNIKSIKNIAFISLGFSIPFIPLLLFDFASNHYQSNNIIEYLFNGGNTNSLPKRWLTYIGVFWPTSYAHIIGGYMPFGALTAIISISVLLFFIWKKRIEKTIFIILVFLSLNFIVLRYFKGHIYDAFLVFLHPAILLITAWVVYKLIKFNKYLGIVFFLVIAIATLTKNYEEIVNATNHTATYSMKMMQMLEEKYPDKKFAVYDFQFKNSSKSNSLVLYLLKNDLISDNGQKIGFLQATISAELDMHNATVIHGAIRENPILVDLGNYDRKQLESRDWEFVNPSAVYESVIHWYEKEN